VRERQFAGPGAREAALGADDLVELPDEGGATDAEGVTVAEAEVAAPEPEDATEGSDEAAAAEAPPDDASAGEEAAPADEVPEDTAGGEEEPASAEAAPEDTASAGDASEETADGGDADSAPAEAESDADDSETRGS
jgi:hypothetical protein